MVDWNAVGFPIASSGLGVHKLGVFIVKEVALEVCGGRDLVVEIGYCFNIWGGWGRLDNETRVKNTGV